MDIGSADDVSSRYWNGSIDTINFYLNEVLSESDFNAQYELGRGNYALNDTVAQYSGRDYNGTASSPDTIYDTNFLSSKDENLNALNFDGVDGYVDIAPLGVNTSESFTISITHIYIYLKTRYLGSVHNYRLIPTIRIYKPVLRFFRLKQYQYHH
jgi:hypothetical protein